MRNRQAQADEVRSRLELEQSQDTLVRTQSQIEVDVQNALIAVTQSKAQVASAREAVRLEEQRLDAEQQKQAAGLSTSYNVVLTQRDLFTAQLAEVQARDAYAKARVALDQAMGVTLENSRLNLDAVLRGRPATEPTLRLAISCPSPWPSLWGFLPAADSSAASADHCFPELPLLPPGSPS